MQVAWPFLLNAFWLPSNHLATIELALKSRRTYGVVSNSKRENYNEA
jgi:hypothetical protein